jgi:hypothetical protein
MAALTGGHFTDHRGIYIMSNQVEKVFLKLTSAIAVDGFILRAGHIVEMVEHEAKDLLRRGKAVLASLSDHPKAPAAEQPAAPVVEPVEPAAPAADEAKPAKPAKAK